MESFCFNKSFVSKHYRAGVLFSSINISFWIFLLCHNISAQGIGRIGINTTSPQALLHVKDSSVVFTGPAVLPGPSPAPVIGAGNRMMWYADKAAFRAGKVEGNQWNSELIGLYSFASGLNNKAIGESSLAVGSNNIVFGNSATVLGLNSSAEHGATLASGNFVSAKGFASVAFGDHTIALLNNSIATGYYSQAKGANSQAHGFNVIAKPFASFALGRYNDTTAISQIDWIDTDPLFIIGNGTASNARKNAMTILKNGNTGINIIQPLVPLHVVKNSTSNTPAHMNAIGIFDSNQDTYIQLASPNNSRSGLIRTNGNNIIRGGMVFEPDSTISFVTQGVKRMVISPTGNVGIGTQDPEVNLHVVNGLKVGNVPLSAINTIAKSHLQTDVGTISANSSLDHTFTFTNVAPGGSVTVSPDTNLPSGIVIAYARVSAANTVLVRFTNVTSASINPPFMGYYITIIQ